MVGLKIHTLTGRNCGVFLNSTLNLSKWTWCAVHSFDHHLACDVCDASSSSQLLHWLDRKTILPKLIRFLYAQHLDKCTQLNLAQCILCLPFGVLCVSYIASFIHCFRFMYVVFLVDLWASEFLSLQICNVCALSTHWLWTLFFAIISLPRPLLFLSKTPQLIGQKQSVRFGGHPVKFDVRRTFENYFSHSWCLTVVRSFAVKKLRFSIAKFVCVCMNVRHIVRVSL